MEEEQTKRENWVEEYNRMDTQAKIARMNRHIVEYIAFSAECEAYTDLDEAEIQLLWSTWCTRSGLK